MNRFSLGRTSSKTLRQTLLVLIIFGLSLFCLIQGISLLQQTNNQNQIDRLLLSLKRSVIHCYATEGGYPESLDYIKQHYSLSWNPSEYVVDYEIFGSNLPPDITVISLKTGEVYK